MPWQQRASTGFGWASVLIKNVSYLIMALHVALVDFRRFTFFDRHKIPSWLRPGDSDGESP